MAGFDWSKYKPATAAPSPEDAKSTPFDWSRYGTAPTTRPGSEVSASGAFVRGAVQGGTLGFGDEIGGAMQAGLQKLANVASGHPWAVNALDSVGIDARYPQDGGEVYRQARDENREQDAEAQHQHPGMFATGAITGALATAKPFGDALGAVVPGLAARGLLPAVATGAVLGGINGLGTSTATTPGAMAQDALGVSGAKQAFGDIHEGNYSNAALDALGSGALGGALSTVGGYALGKGVIQPIASKIAESAAGRVLTNGARQLSTRLPLSQGARRAALDFGAIAPLGTTEGAFSRLEAITGDEASSEAAAGVANRKWTGNPTKVGAAYHDLLDALQQQGVPGAEVRPLADEMANRAAHLDINSGADKTIPNLWQDEGANIERIAQGKPNLDFQQAEALKRDLQARARYGRFNDSQINAAKKDIASLVRQANEDAVAKAGAAAPEVSAIRALAEEFVPLKRTLGNLLEAQEAAREGVARGSHRAMLSLPESIAIASDPTEGKKWLGALTHALWRSRGPSTVATAANTLSRPDVVAQLAAALQRGQEAGRPKPPDVWYDENGVPHVTVHVGDKMK